MSQCIFCRPEVATTCVNETKAAAFDKQGATSTKYMESPKISVGRIASAVRRYRLIGSILFGTDLVVELGHLEACLLASILALLARLVALPQ